MSFLLKNIIFERYLRQIGAVVILIALLICPFESLAKNKKPATRKQPATRYELLADTLLSKGIVYKRIHLSIAGAKHDVHVIQADLKEPEAELKIMKAGNYISDLAKLQDINAYFDSLDQTKVVASINANFWRAYTNFPIGPVIVGGEIVEMHSYKEWSSIFINEAGEPFIDNFKIQGIISNKKLQDFAISYVNRRRDTNGIVLYNRYGGQAIPHINPKKVEEKLYFSIENLLHEQEFDDSTEVDFDIEALHAEIAEMERESSIEYGTTKLVLEYLTMPAINSNFFVKVKAIDTNSVSMPYLGCVLSLGKDFDLSNLPNIGDTLLIKFVSNVHNREVFTAAVSGTPRLVRNGVATHEAKQEGSTGRRFINHKLPRTAIGYNKTKDKMYLVAVRGNNRQDKTSGANLSQMASIMKYLGCYNAMNLDGGGSTIMVIDGRNVLSESNPNSSRRISVGIGFSNEYSFKRFINSLIEE